jgi:arsenate reductase
MIKSNGKGEEKMIIIYGIKNCDTCKKAIKHFSGQATFRDIRDFPLSKDTLEKFLFAFGGDLINTRSQTWRALTNTDKLLNKIDLINKYPTVMKRPVIAHFDALSIGWNDLIKSKFT